MPIRCPRPPASAKPVSASHSYSHLLLDFLQKKCCLRVGLFALFNFSIDEQRPFYRSHPLFYSHREALPTRRLFACTWRGSWWDLT